MHDHRPAAPLLTPASITRVGGKFVVAVQGMQIGVVTSKAQAVTALCKEAVSRKETIVTTVLEGAGRTYMTMTPTGHVSPSAAPAPGSLKPNLSGPEPTGDMGVSAQSADSTRSWVEENLLVDNSPAPVKKRRFGIGPKR